MLECVRQLEALAARLMRKFCEFCEELAGALSLEPTRFHEHILRSPKQDTVDSLRSLVAQKRPLVSHPERFFIAALQSKCEREYLAALLFSLRVEALRGFSVFFKLLACFSIQLSFEDIEKFIRP